jgi:hypothetical protein
MKVAEERILCCRRCWLPLMPGARQIKPGNRVSCCGQLHELVEGSWFKRVAS